MKFFVIKFYRVSSSCLLDLSTFLIILFSKNFGLLFMKVTFQPSQPYKTCLNRHWGRFSAVGVAIRYWLDGPGIESRWGLDFPHPSRPALGFYSASCTVGTGSFPGVKRPGRGVDHPPASSTEIEGRVELYICSPSGPSWPVLGRTLPLHFYLNIH